MAIRYRLLLASIIYLISGLFLFTGYRFIVDDDGIGYMMVARRLAEGDWHNAINGYWSPLHSWMAVPLIKSGLTEMDAFKLSNWLIGLLILVVTHRLSNKLTIRDGLKTLLLLVTLPVIIYYVTAQVAGDLLFCLLLLIYVDLITSKNFFERTSLNIAAGLVAALMYFSKAYGFPFFILHFIVLQVWFWYSGTQQNRTRWLVRNMVLCFGTFLLLASPWIWLLYEKYRLFTFGYSGSYNLDVHLYGRNYTTDAIATATPYTDSPCHWEDPWFIPMKRIPGLHYFTAEILARQIRLFLTNVMRGISAFNQLSYLALAGIAVLGLYLAQHRNRVLSIFFITAILLPAGYLLVFIGSRYIWPLSLLALISGTFLLQEYFYRNPIHKRWIWLSWFIFFSSFLIYPVNELKDSYRSGSELFTLVEFAKERNIKGNFLVHGNGKSNYAKVQSLAFFTRSSMFFRLQPDAADEEVLKSLQQNKIRYYFFIYDMAREKEDFMKSSLYHAASKVYDPGIYNMMILEIN